MLLWGHILLKLKYILLEGEKPEQIDDLEIVHLFARLFVCLFYCWYLLYFIKIRTMFKYFFKKTFCVPCKNIIWTEG